MKASILHALPAHPSPHFTPVASPAVICVCNQLAINQKFPQLSLWVSKIHWLEWPVRELRDLKLSYWFILKGFNLGRVK